MSRELKHSEELENTFVDERVKELLPKFEALVTYKPRDRERGKGGKIGWKALAAMESALLKATYPDEDKPEPERTYGTCLRQITALKKELKKAARKQLKDKQNYNPVCTIIGHFGEALSFQFAEYKYKQNVQYREKVQERSTKENRIELDLSPYLKQAHQVLSQVKQGAKPTDIEWRDVSCALALVTGRRMAEIHLSAEFEQISDYCVSFKGQLKGKSRKIKGESLRFHEFIIPTLVEASLVVAGLEWLGKNQKRFPKSEETERVNRRWSKVLSQRCKQEWAIMERMTYHKFRACYLRACLANEKVDPFDYQNYAQSILGDADEGTIRAYQRFMLAPSAETRI
ncbi:MAG: hypothetical protein F6K24_14910 [Okeania sp. SIO2D1]|nr:hypothetical protein [Okeania sp. SIO2D1]